MHMGYSILAFETHTDGNEFCRNVAQLTDSTSFAIFLVTKKSVFIVQLM